MLSRINSTKYNLYTSIMYQLISAIANIIVRKIFIDYLGLYYLSLDGYFSNIISMLNLLDLGIGSSSMYFLAKAYSSNDDEEIYATFLAFRKLYKILAIIITVFGLGCCLFISNLVDIGSYSINYIRLIFLLTLIRTIIYYLCSVPKNALLISQRNYINMIINIICVITFSVIRIVSIVLLGNYIVYILLLFIETWVNLSLSKIYFNKFNVTTIKLAKEKINEKIHNIVNYGKNLIIVNINNFIFNSTDNLIINWILGLNFVGLMSNYYMIINSISLFANQILESAHASIYNFLNDKQNDLERANSLLDTLTFISFIVSLFCSVCLFGLTDEFIGIVYGNKYVLNKSVILLFVLNLVILLFQSPLTAYSVGKGLVKYEIYYSTAMALINLIVSIVLGWTIGIEGILLGTLLANLTITFGKMRIVVKNMKFSQKNYLIKISKYLFVTILALFVVYFIFPQECSSIVSFILRGILCIILFVVGILLFYRTREFNEVKKIVLNFIGRN